MYYTIHESHMRKAIGYLSGAIPELGSVEISLLAEKWEEALRNTDYYSTVGPVDEETADPVNMESEAPPAKPWDVLRGEPNPPLMKNGTVRFYEAKYSPQCHVSWGVFNARPLVTLDIHRQVFVAKSLRQLAEFATACAEQLEGQ